MGAQPVPGRCLAPSNLGLDLARNLDCPNTHPAAKQGQGGLRLRCGVGGGMLQLSAIPTQGSEAPSTKRGHGHFMSLSVMQGAARPPLPPSMGHFTGLRTAPSLELTCTETRARAGCMQYSETGLPFA